MGNEVQRRASRGACRCTGDLPASPLLPAPRWMSHCTTELRRYLRPSKAAGQAVNAAPFDCGSGVSAPDPSGRSERHSTKL